MQCSIIGNMILYQEPKQKDEVIKYKFVIPSTKLCKTVEK